MPDLGKYIDKSCINPPGAHKSGRNLLEKLSGINPIEKNVLNNNLEAKIQFLFISSLLVFWHKNKPGVHTTCPPASAVAQHLLGSAALSCGTTRPPAPGY